MMNATIRLVASVLIVGATPLSAQEFEDVAQWCYAAADLLSEETSDPSYDYDSMKEQLGDFIDSTYGIDRAQALSNGMSELTAAAKIANESTEAVASKLYRNYCTSVFAR